MMNVGENRARNGITDCPESRNEKKSKNLRKTRRGGTPSVRTSLQAVRLEATKIFGFPLPRGTPRTNLLGGAVRLISVKSTELFKTSDFIQILPLELIQLLGEKPIVQHLKSLFQRFLNIPIALGNVSASPDRRFTLRNPSDQMMARIDYKLRIRCFNGTLSRNLKVLIPELYLVNPCGAGQGTMIVLSADNPFARTLQLPLL
ncbi:hypothetical protein E3N88_09311 [Mikania micrantha]|uniref:Uncharacterized protein n=1 Tax=Mikania micrantha TaxID=192012 RepID=A0A5N6PLS3_9ASTR|nr:hypothetical protein E3N88_09311 [Mikania micrantha]